MKFKHPSSTLVVEIALQLYEDARSKCAHVTASIIYPTRRVFLNPVVLRDESSDSLKELVEEVIKSSLGCTFFTFSVICLTIKLKKYNVKLPYTR